MIIILLCVVRFLVRVAYLEIYNEEVRDLLGKDQHHRLEVRTKTSTTGLMSGQRPASQAGGKGKDQHHRLEVRAKTSTTGLMSGQRPAPQAGGKDKDQHHRLDVRIKTSTTGWR